MKEQLKQQPDNNTQQQFHLENHCHLSSTEIRDKILLGPSKIYDVTEGIPSKHTRTTYQENFNRFLNKIKIHDKHVLLDFSPKVIKQIIIDYIRYLSEERKIRRDSIKTQIAPIIRFFRINNDDFHLRMDNFKLHLPPDESINEDRPYTTEEIAQVIRVCDPSQLHASWLRIQFERLAKENEDFDFTENWNALCINRHGKENVYQLLYLFRLLWSGLTGHL
jgi:hypothetical protein